MEVLSSFILRLCSLFADINGAVESVASLHEENYIKFCLDLLNQWLQPKCLLSGLVEDTYGLTKVLQNYKEAYDSDKDSLLRYNGFNSLSKNVMFP